MAVVIFRVLNRTPHLHTYSGRSYGTHAELARHLFHDILIEKYYETILVHIFAYHDIWPFLRTYFTVLTAHFIFKSARVF